ncbi:MAG: HlyU family transcriptional regulator [Nitrospira sp. BO4]|jgi:hypothetical protein|nr:HlyU family transcriptional regulator [Nitrospira sp. BO4]
MTRAVAYKGFIIRPAPQQLVESGMWGLNLFISWSIHNQEHSLHFFKDEAYASKDEAEAICINYGKLIIDGEIPGASVG